MAETWGRIEYVVCEAVAIRSRKNSLKREAGDLYQWWSLGVLLLKIWK